MAGDGPRHVLKHVANRHVAGQREPDVGVERGAPDLLATRIERAAEAFLALPEEVPDLRVVDRDRGEPGESGRISVVRRAELPSRFARQPDFSYRPARMVC